MELTMEKARALTELLNSDPVFADRILQLTPAEASEELKKRGSTYAPEELTEYCDEVRKCAVTLAENKELDESALEDVSGGSLTLFLVGGCCGAIIGGCIKYRTW